MNLHPLPLPGCAPTPLAHYLKALGILLLLSEQLPPDLARPRGAWQGETFVLHTPLDRADIVRFFLQDYQPTPILAPWNRGSGFHLGAKQDGFRALSGSAATRFADYKSALAVGQAALSQLKLTSKPTDEEKERLLRVCRSRFPERALRWLDAALVLTGEGPKYPPLLGTGGNDGRLDFTNNFMQRLVELFDPATGQCSSEAATLLAGSLFAEPTRGLRESAIGQFFPLAAGGANSTSGFDAKALSNPWDFVLMLEGTLMFAAAVAKRLESTGPGELAYPFSVRPSGVGYASSSGADASARCELWAPLWERPAAVSELSHLLGEGHARLATRAARDGFEFTRAVAALGVDRGVSAFQRFSFAPRNGLAFFATPLNRIPVRRRSHATQLLDDLDHDNWLERSRSAGRGDHTPNAVAFALRQLEQTALVLLRCSQQEDDEQAAVESLLMAVSDTEAALGRSLRWAKEMGLQPVPQLSDAWWRLLRHGKDAELDLAAGLASLRQPSLRVHWERLDSKTPFLVWYEHSCEAIWQDSLLEETLLAIHQRRILLEPNHTAAFNATYAVQPASIAAFLDHQTDDLQLARLARALSLVRLPPDADGDSAAGMAESCEDACAKLPALFSLPRLALAGRAPKSRDPMPRLAAILRHGATQDGQAATRLALQRLRRSGFVPALNMVPVYGASVRRALAATLFPVSRRVLDTLADQLRPLPPSD